MTGKGRISEDKRLAFVLAGCSGAGKSTLLEKAFRQKIPIFGKELDDAFQADPMCLSERHNPHKALKEDAVFQAKSIPQLHALQYPPMHSVIHLDILNLPVRLVNHPFHLDEMQADLKALQPREPEHLIDQELNKRMFRDFLGPSFRTSDLVLINTLHTPYAKNAEQWRQNALAHPSVDQDLPLFAMHDPRPDIHQALYASWSEVVQEMNVHESFVSTLEEDVLRLVPSRPGTQGARKCLLR